MSFGVVIELVEKVKLQFEEQVLLPFLAISVHPEFIVVVVFQLPISEGAESSFEQPNTTSKAIRNNLLTNFDTIFIILI
jgi:hypothetical protein